MFQNEEYKFVRRKGTRLCQPESNAFIKSTIDNFQEVKNYIWLPGISSSMKLFQTKVPIFHYSHKNSKSCSLKNSKSCTG